MEYSIQQADGDLIIATASGEWDQATDNAMIREVMEAVNTSDSRKVLVDIRELRFDMPILQIFERALELRQQRGEFGTTTAKVALVYPSAGKKMEDDLAFFETAARNRGLPYRTFKDMEAALAWLGEDS
jgi:hypothetical protein